MDKVKVKDKNNDEEDEVVRLVPVKTYLPKTEVDFAGASYFAGQEDEFILVATKSGDILFWDQESGVRICLEMGDTREVDLFPAPQRLLHALRNKDVGDGDLTSVAWNYALKRHMLASACHDGSVRIWTGNMPERDNLRGKERETATVVGFHPYGLDGDLEVSASPMNSSRRPTSTAEGTSQAHGEPITYAMGRPSMEGSAEGGGQSFGELLDRKDRRRVDSPLPV